MSAAAARCAQIAPGLAFAVALAIAPTAMGANEDGDGVIEAGEDETAELARAVQNPVANLISLPFQNNTNFEFGPREKTQNVLNIQIQGFYNAARPDLVGRWTLRTQLQFLVPKRR
jgi:hypothetical protein